MPRVPALSILCLTILAGACTDSRSQEDALAQDTSLTRDLALANQDTALKPELRDVPVTAEQTAAPAVARAQTPRVERRTTAPTAVVKRPAPAPSRSAPAETPEVRVTESGNTERVTERGSEQSLGVVSVGSQISLEAGQKVCTNTNSIGDRFTAQISNPVMGANGTVIPVGATAIVSISSLHRSQRAGDDIEIGLRVESISYGGRTYPVVSETTYAQVDRVRAEARSDDAKKVATGAVIGAVVGQILGKRTKSTVIGAATGAAAGAVVASRNANYDGCVPAGGTITIRLTEPLTIQTTE